MNYKKTGLLLIIVPLLASCAKEAYIGEYTFQMGKNKDTHIAVSLKLEKEIYDEAQPGKGKKFALGFDMVTSEVEDELSSILKSISPLTGYYRIDKENKVYDETRLNIGINLLGEYEVPQTITDNFFVASINATLVNFYLPVSMDDLSYQLYWYGYDLNISNIFDSITSDEENTEDPIASVDGVHPVGSHPTKEDIDKINEHYPDAHNGNLYRDFHVLKLGLTKK